MSPPTLEPPTARFFNPSTFAAPGAAGLFWGASLGIVAVLCKATVLTLTAFDGTGVPLENAWWPLAAFYQDLLLALAFGLFAGTATWMARGVRAVVLVPLLFGVYLLLAIYSAANVPVARLLSSPLTYAFIHATGAAIGDSLTRYLTFGNVAAPLLLAAIAVALPLGWSRHLTARRITQGAPLARKHLAPAVAAGVGLALGLAGPRAVRHTETRGLHRNAVGTLLTTTLARHGSAADEPFVSLDSASCRPTPESSPLEPEAAAFLSGAKARNLVWVILESTGARALSFTTEGKGETGRDPMPHLSQLAQQALIFDRAYTAYPESIKGLFASLCGREPPPHREASELGAERVPCRAVATELARAGYRSGLFHSGWFAYLGMTAVVEKRGFDVLVDARTISSPSRSSFGVDDSSTAARLLRWLDDEHLGHTSERPFFAVFMPIAGHHPYHAPGHAERPWPETDDHDAYLNDLHVADEAWGQLRDGLVARGLDQRTTYVIVGDHGEAFREHAGNIAHALYIYEENVHVPLVIAAPGLVLGPIHSRAIASSIDLAPTFLTLAGVPDSGSPPFHGRSLLNASPRVARFFTEQGGRRAGLRDGRWKLIIDTDDQRSALYDLATDPAERLNVASSQPSRVDRYRACLQGF